MTTKRFTHTALILSGVAMISLSSAARAGFEWKGPLEAPAPVVEAPADTGNMSDLAPVTAGPAPQAPAPQAMAPAAPEAMAPPAGDALAGFASDVPLVMALQQIVPPGYQYSFASGVNPGASVSWEGGKPWQGVLGDMLSKQGLSYALQNNTVVVSFPQGGVAPQMSDGAPAPAAPAADMSNGSSAAPMSIISQPPAKNDQSSAGANGMTAMPPSDNAAAPPAPSANAPMAEKPKEVDIRRKRTPTLFERLGFTHHDDSAASAPAQPEPAPAPQQPQPQKMAAADQPPVMTDMSQSGSQAAPASSMSSGQTAPASMTAPPAQAAAQSTAMSSMPGAAAWQGAKGQTLRDVLKSWSDKAGVDLYWSIDYDYRLGDDMTFPGSYDEAVGHLLDKFAAVRPQPYGQLHQGGSGPRVLVIKSYDVAQ